MRALAALLDEERGEVLADGDGLARVLHDLVRGARGQVGALLEDVLLRVPLRRPLSHSATSTP